MKVVARYADYGLPLHFIHRGLGRGWLGGSRLDLDKTKNLPLPPDQTDFAVPQR